MTTVLRNPELEAAIQRAPDDREPYLLYADWLSERGDPRGELIALDVALEDREALRREDPFLPRELERRRAHLYKEHGRAWCGALLETDDVDTYWRRGFIRGAFIGHDDSPEGTDGARLYAALRTLPAAVALRELTFAVPSPPAETEPCWEGCTRALAEHGVPPTFRSLAYRRGYWDLSETRLGALEPLYAAVPWLEDLSIALGRMDLGRIELPALRSFAVTTGGLSRANIRSVCEARWPALERLDLCFGEEAAFGAECTLDDVLPLLEPRGLDRLHTLGIRNAPFVNELVPRIATSGVLRRLRELDLSMGTLGDEGAQSILEHAAAFRHLEVLDVSTSFLSDDAVVRLRAELPCVKSTDQEREVGEDGVARRFCNIGE